MLNWMPRPLKTLFVRVYTLAIMGVVLLAGYMAVTYLYQTVFQPAQPPPQVLEWQGVTEAEQLRAASARGITEPAIRAPLGHYHAVDRWFQPDLRNGCITSGCHDPIPHRKSKELRAFANLHATFMSCEVCHREPSATPMPAVWVDLKTGESQPPPAILQLMGRLTAATQPADLADQNTAILDLLRQCIDVIGYDAILDHLYIQLDTSEPGSPVWRQGISQLQAELPNHARGEYGAKIMPATAPGAAPIVRDFSGLVDQYFSRAADQAGRSEAHHKIHEGVIAAPEGCLLCHRAEPPMLDFQALGYTPERIRALTSTPVATMMQQIRQGQQFQLPLGP